VKINGEIPFKKKFIEKIRKGLKTTTIRTFKWAYVLNGIYKVKNSDLKIKIIDVDIVNIPNDIDDKLVKSEGFKDKEEMLKFFRRYKLPQLMFLYKFKVV